MVVVRTRRQEPRGLVEDVVVLQEVVEQRQPRVSGDHDQRLPMRGRRRPGHALPRDAASVPLGRQRKGLAVP